MFIEVHVLSRDNRFILGSQHFVVIFVSKEDTLLGYCFKLCSSKLLGLNYPYSTAKWSKEINIWFAFEQSSRGDILLSDRGKTVSRSCSRSDSLSPPFGA